MKYLVIYRVYDKNEKYKYFVENGKYEHEDVEYLLTDNDDFMSEVDVQKYDRFVYLDSTVDGPFYPKYLKNGQWIHYYEEMRSAEKVQMLGSHPVNNNEGIYITYPHIMTREAVQLLDFKETAPFRCMRVIAAGWDIGSMIGVTLADIVRNKSQIYEENVNKYEVLFTSTVSRSVTDEWDYLSYILSNKDLYKRGISTEESALQHYTSTGWKEKRPIRRDIGTRYLTVCLSDIGNKFHSLCDQLNCLVTAIIIGHYTRRAVVTDYLYTSHEARTTVPLNAVIDIDKLNSDLNRLGISTRVIVAASDTVYNNRLKSAPDSILKNCNSMYNGTDYLKYLYELYYEDSEGINIGIPLTDLNIDHAVYPKLKSMFSSIIQILSPTLIMNDVVSEVKKNMGLSDDYVALHLRLEDEILEYQSNINNNNYGVQMLQLYDRLMGILQKSVSKDRLFIATGLGKRSNSYNFLLDDYSALSTKEFRKKLSIPYAEGTDMDSLLDYLISKESSLFIGTDSSTFSKYIKYSDGTAAIYLHDLYFDKDDRYCILKYENNSKIERVTDSNSIRADGPSVLIIAVAVPITVRVQSNDKSIVISGTTSNTKVLNPGLHTITVTNTGKYEWSI